MSEKIDINVANEETLATISGIGPVLAKRIVEYRQTVHPFEEVIELTAVPGISERMVRGFEHLVTVQPVAKVTAVPLYRDDPEDFPLLDAPEEPVLLAAQRACWPPKRLPCPRQSSKKLRQWQQNRKPTPRQKRQKRQKR